MGFITFLKKKRKKKILEEICLLKVESATFLEKSNSEKIKAENFLEEIKIHQNLAKHGSHYSMGLLSCYLSEYLDEYQKYSLSSTINHTKYENIESQIKLLEEELSAL